MTIDTDAASAQARADGIEKLAAAVLVSDTDGRVLLLRRAKEEAFSGWWEYPSGGLEPGEDIRDGAARELREEAGLTGLDLAYAMHIDYTNQPGRTSRQFVFTATVPAGTAVVLSAEHDEQIWTYADQLPPQVSDGGRSVVRQIAPPNPITGWVPLPQYLTRIPHGPAYGALFCTTTDGAPVLLRAADPALGLQFPGGDMEFHDATPLHTAVRECFEETGIRLDPDPKLHPLLTSIFRSPADGWPMKFGFVHKGPQLSPAQIDAIKLDPREHSEVVIGTAAEYSSDCDRDKLIRSALRALRTGMPEHIVLG